VNKSFWTERWAEGRIGFHQDQVHSDLLSHGLQHLGTTQQRVLVPLCGKTNDLLWFANQDHAVVGVDLSALAIAQWHTENNRSANGESISGATRYRSENVEMWCGDVLELGPETLGQFDLVWDRAAMVALMPEQRILYAQRLHALLRPGGRLLINSFEYDQTQMEGPPHSVPLSELQQLFPNWTCQLLQNGKWLREGKFRDRGVDQFRDYLAVLTA
jgi:thiopurine S-methyltransferase